MSETVQLKKVEVNVSADETVKSITLGERTIKNNDTYDGIEIIFETVTVAYKQTPEKVFRPTAAITFKERATVKFTGGKFVDNTHKPLQLIDSNGNTVIFRAD